MFSLVYHKFFKLIRISSSLDSTIYEVGTIHETGVPNSVVLDTGMKLVLLVNDVIRYGGTLMGFDIEVDVGGLMKIYVSWFIFCSYSLCIYDHIHLWCNS